VECILVEAALAESKCFPLKKKIAPPHPTQKRPYSQQAGNPLAAPRTGVIEDDEASGN
jgi:hypothetical protein